MKLRIVLGSIALLASAAAALAADWSPPVEVRLDEDLCVSYQARLDGGFLVVRATLGPGWHTFAMDNQQRATEKLAGRLALSVDQSTEITPSGGLETIGPWYQSPPKDFSRPELRWFSWGFDRQGLFAVKVRRAGSAPAARLAIRGQACTDSKCKNIDAALSLPVAGFKPDGAPSETNLKDLVRVR